MVFEYCEEGGELDKYGYKYIGHRFAEYYAGRKIVYGSTSPRRDWHADYLEEQKPPVKEIEPELGFTRISWFDDGRFKVKRVPIVHG